MSDDVLELTVTEYESTTEAEFSGDVWELTIETGQRGPVGIGGEEITHGDLPGRNLPDQHSASAIDVDGTPLDTVLDNVPLLDAANEFTDVQSIDVQVPVTSIADIATTKPTVPIHVHGGGAAVDLFAITASTGESVFKTAGVLTAVIGFDGQPTGDWIMLAVGAMGPGFLRVTSSDPDPERPPFIGDLFTGTPEPLSVGTPTADGHAATKAYVDANGGGGAVDSVNGETGVVVLDAADVGAAATSHTHAASDVTSGTLDIARIPTGTTGSTVPFGNDSRFTDSRTPTAHKTSHATGGGDALAPSDIGAAPTSRTVTAGTGLTGGGDLSADRTFAVSYGLTASTAVEGIALPRKAWRAGSYYATDVLPSNSGNNIASGQVKAMGFYNPVAGRPADQIAIDVHTGSAGSGILYICTDDGTGYPGTVVASGTMSTPTTSTRSTTSISYTLPRGQLWLVCHGTGTTWAGLALFGQSFYMPAPSAYSANPISCWNATGAGTSALTSFPAGATAASNGVQILIRAA